MIDFEQLKIENQTLNEKIEERNEELSKLKRKKTLTVQILTHIREKLRYVEQSNRALQEKLAELESYISTRRNNVTSKKLDRDTLRGENKEFKAKQGFASSDLLLVDYEKRKYQTTEMHASITELKNRYDLLAKQMQYSTGSGGLYSSGSTSKPGLLMSMTGSVNNAGQAGIGGLQINRGTTGFPVSR
jgi:histone deacetylase 6